MGNERFCVKSACLNEMYHFQGERQLPTQDEMQADVKAKQDDMGRRYVKSTRHTIQVDQIPFMDELADHIGCKPQLSKNIFF